MSTTPPVVAPERFFLDRFGLSQSLLEQIVGGAIARQADFADLYFEFRTVESFSLEDGIVKKANKNVSQGVGVRVVAGDKTGYAHSDDVTVENLQLAARSAQAIAQEGGASQSVAIRGQTLGHDLYQLDHSPLDVALNEKIALLNQIDIAARRHDPRIKNVFASLGVERKLVLIAGSAGFIVGDVQPLLRLNVTCIAEEGSLRQHGTYGGGGRVEFDFLTEGERYLRFARTAAEQALRNLHAVDAPAGSLTVVLGPGWPGVLLHEAVGHGLEGDFNRKGTSAFAGCIGERVASELCTVVDDGTIANRRGSLNVDDEGTPTGRTVLIEKGILRAYLQDRLNARLMGVPLTGNGRRESFAHLPMPRMTNTFMLAGDSTKDEIIRSVDHGLYAAYFGGGQVDITNGKFVFSATEAYLIEGGQITRPVKGATLIGSGPEALKRVSMVGNDLQLDEGIGTCGKDGQSVPVGVGLPTIRIDGITVGGTRT
ncbi:MAG: metalloprotease TldD [Deltaproteobacteria bacterium]|nr:metalloprotease TldD [Deltaproteobacteria bacterium]MBI3388668.1 metalloprotease TldD [Deltaproteobacteria bacterium]